MRLVKRVIAWLKERKRLRIIFWATVLGAFCGLSEFGLPAEESLRALRNEVFQRRADQSIIVVALDDRTMNGIKATTPPRSDDAKVVDRLFALGAKRVFFDKAFADQSSAAEDSELHDAFLRHEGKVFVGAIAPDPRSGREGTWPLAMYQQTAKILSMSGEEGPFGLSARFPLLSKGPAGYFPSISAELAHTRPEKEKTYRPDFSIAVSSIPTVSYIDVLRERGHQRKFQGRDVILGPTSELAHDLHWVPFNGTVPGVYFHVLGAQTLKEGLPLDVGWFPAFAFAIFALIGLFRLPAISALKASGYGSATAMFVSMLMPFFSISIDVVPGILTFIIGSVRLGLDARRRTNSVSGLPSISSLRSSEVIPGDHVFALKIGNYASIKACCAQNVETPLIAEISRRITMSDEARVISHDQDMLVWTRPALALEDLRDHAHGLHALIGTGVSIGGSLFDVAVSIGVDVNYDEALAARVDEAMQCAEDAALATHVCKIGRRSTAPDRAWNVQILSQLELAMTEGQLWVAYQPKVSLLTGKPTGVEALIRWTHPERGLIGPSLFIPIAEQHNRMEPLTTFVLDRAFRTLSVIDSIRPGFQMSVNISTQMLRSERILDLLEHALEKHRVQSGQVILEITETAPVDTDDDALTVLAKIKARGFQLSIDDFGTGGATLEYLVKIPADEVKIDQMFITDLATSAENRALARSVIKMAHLLGRTVVAEGIESAEVARALKEMGCDEGQGFLFDKAVSAGDLYIRLARQSESLTA